jgi:hypothetical protein
MISGKNHHLNIFLRNQDIYDIHVYRKSIHNASKNGTEYERIPELTTSGVDLDKYYN